MALTTTGATIIAEQGETTQRANIIHKVEFNGDAAYPAAGSADFQAFIRELVGDQVTITGIHGYAITSGAISHVLHYDSTADTLEMYAIANGAAVSAGDLSGARCHVVVFSQ